MAKKKRNQFDWDEIYRGFRTNMEFSQMDEEIQVISVASTIPNEGKSSVACNLARIMAAKYKNVLLIDCDINKPMVHESFKIQNKVGLTEILEKKDYVNYEKYTSQFNDAYSDNVLYVMSAGSNLKHPIDLLSGQDFKEFMNVMKSEFNFIIVDCPSLED